jgi:Zn-dependent peptidase ImmA (M78 family)
MQKSKDTIHNFGYYFRYTKEELDLEFQKIIFDFLRKKYNKIEFPISTEDLTILIENNVKDLDIYANLEKNVEGVTTFIKGQKPSVAISSELSENDTYENRLRLTLAHEFGHVKLHNFIVQIKENFSQKCKRDNISNTKQTDWMEWQAFYAGGALLIPIVELKKIIKLTNEEQLISSISKKFGVSKIAAKVRLSQIYY